MESGMAGRFCCLDIAALLMVDSACGPLRLNQVLWEASGRASDCIADFSHAKAPRAGRFSLGAGTARAPLIDACRTGLTGINGQPLTIPNGAMLSADGQIVAAPSGLRDVNGNALQFPAFNGMGPNSSFAPFSTMPNQSGSSQNAGGTNQNNGASTNG